MYTDIIACYFVSCVYNKLYDKSKKTFEFNLLHFMRGFKDREYRNKIYQQIYLLVKETQPTLLFNDFIQKCIDSFYTDFKIDETLLLFDKTIKNGVEEWLNFIFIYETGNKEQIDLIEARIKFIYYLSISINQIILLLNDKEITYTNKQYKQLIDYIKYLKSIKPTEHKTTQTDL